MSGRHRRPEPDHLSHVDLAERLGPGPVIAATPVNRSMSATAGRHELATDEGEGTAAATPGPTVVVRRDRAAERAARRNAFRRRLLFGGGALAGVIVVALGVVYLLGRDGGPGSSPRADGPPRQLTMLVQVTGIDGTAAASALVGTTARDGSAAVILVPSRLSVDAAGAGDLPFGEAVTLGPDASAGALTDLLGVSVSQHWVLDQGALAKLVDVVGGVRAAVDVDVVRTDAKGAETVVVRAGNQRLKGAAAASYASYLGEGEPEQARLARFDDVWGALAAALPGDRAGIVADLAALGDGSSSSLDSTQLAERLLVLHEAAEGGELISDILPVTEIDTGDALPSYGLDAAQAAATLRSRFPDALLRDPSGDVVRVLVENGLGTPGLVEQARGALVSAGYRFINGGNASPFNDDPSSVQVPDGTDKSVARGQRVARTLGLPEDAVVPTERGQTVADVIVILGSDFTPGTGGKGKKGAKAKGGA